MDRQVKIISLLIAMAALSVYVPLLGHVNLFDWDEVNFAEAAREMLVTGEWRYVQINFEPFWEKPPLFIWMQAISMKFFGVNAVAARLPNAFAGMITLPLLFRIGHSLGGVRFGLLWAGVFAGSMLPGFYFRSGIIDPWFNLFIFLGIHQLAAGSDSFPLKRMRVVWAGVFIGLAVLTKGPVGLLIPGICALLMAVMMRERVRIRWSDPLLFLIPVTVIGFSYFIAEILRGHEHVVRDFIAYNLRLASTGEAGHVQPFWYHPLVLLFGCFPASLLFIFGWAKHSDVDSTFLYRRWMQVLFWVVLIVFSIVKTKIVHYSSLTYFPLTFLAAWQLERAFRGEWRLSRAQFTAMLAMAMLLGTAFVLAGMFNVLKPHLLPLVESQEFAFAMLSKDVPEHPLEPLIGVFFLLGSITSLLLLLKRHYRSGVASLLSVTGLTVWLLGASISPKIEAYTQRDLVEFYQEKSTERCYLRPMHFHSYAHLFYGRAVADIDPRSRDVNWLATGHPDRPVYFIVRKGDVPRVHYWFPHIQVVEERGAWLIMQRQAVD